jgi:hypothetical protein
MIRCVCVGAGPPDASDGRRDPTVRSPWFCSYTTPCVHFESFVKRILDGKAVFGMMAYDMIARKSPVAAPFADEMV